MGTESGQTLSHYRLVERIGEGGMGVVWKAADTVLGRTVAIKVLPSDLAFDDERRRMFLDEARLAASVSHGNIVQVYELDRDGDLDFIVMEYVDGNPLSKLLMGRPLPAEKVADWGLQIAQGLARAHRKGLIHRDLKPANLLVTHDGEVKIVDFGLAVLLSRTDTAPDSLMTASAIEPLADPRNPTAGTLPYMSPEQVRGEKLDTRSDVFSFGAVLYEMVTGQRPFVGSGPSEIAHEILSSQPRAVHELVPGAPLDLRRIIDKALAKHAADRYQHMDDLAVDLRRLGRELESGPRVSYEDLAPSIAVLPFADMSIGKDQDYFCEGVAEEIINTLTAVEGLKVAARTSSFRFKSADVDIRKIGEELNVELVLEGSVRAAGNKLRITAQLINARDGYHVWSERYDRPMEDVFAIQDEISESIVSALKTRIGSKGPGTAAARRTENVHAYHLYLRGRHCWNRRHQGVLPRAVEYFQEAIDLDPGYSLAYVGLADSYNVFGFYGFQPPDRAFARARAAAEKALEIHPEQTEAYASLGYVNHHHDWNWIHAEQSYERVLRSKPDYAVGHQWYSLYLASRGRHEGADHSIRRARELDPLSPVINTAVGWISYFRGLHDEALRELRTTLDLEPSFPWLRYVLSHVHVQLSQFAEATAHAHTAVAISEEASFYVAGLGYCLARAGDMDGAQHALQTLRSRQSHSYVSSMDIAVVLVGMGDEESTLEALDDAYEERSSTLVYVGVDPRFDSVRTHPKFSTLIERLNLE